MKATLIQPVRKESINAESKRWINSKFSVEKFITASKEITDSQEHQYDEVISRTGDDSFSLSFNNLEVGLEWFQWDSTKCKKHRKVAFKRNVLAEDYANESVQAIESFQVDLINDIIDLSCNNLLFPSRKKLLTTLKPSRKS